MYLMWGSEVALDASASHLTLCCGHFSTFKARSLLRGGGVLELVHEDRVQAALGTEPDVLKSSNHRSNLLALDSPAPAPET